VKSTANCTEQAELLARVGARAFGVIQNGNSVGADFSRLMISVSALLENANKQQITHHRYSNSENAR
jgi:hypothetical protein